MKKTLLIAAAALAAGVISSQAQVYSQNIVGYVNQAAPAGFIAANNPLNNSAGNNATNLFDCTSGNNDGSTLLLWSGTHYVTYLFQSSGATLFRDGSNQHDLPAPTLNPGQGFYFNNQNDPVLGGGVISNLTFVGSVAVDAPPTGTQTVGTTSNVISGSLAYVFISSRLPVGGGVTSVLGITNDINGDLDGSVVLQPNIINGAVKGFVTTLFNSASPTGFRNANNTATAPEPVIPVGGSFLFQNQSGADYLWIQSL
jgi:hypothetical protein